MEKYSLFPFRETGPQCEQTGPDQADRQPVTLYCCQSPPLCHNHHSPVYDSKKKNSHV